MIYVKYVQSGPCVVNGSDVICGVYMCVHLPYNPIKYLAYILSLFGIFVSGTYLRIVFEIDVAVSCGLACKDAKVLDLCAHRMY